VFLVFAGPSVLDVTNIAWLATGDRAMHQLGWMAFRQTPWGWPPGASPELGIELSNSIALVDGLPLLAFPIKLIAGLLPATFQYWGIWLLLSFVLQGLFGYLFARTLGAGKLAALVAGGFVLVTPAFLFRIPMHLALSGHWTILAALWLYGRSTPTGTRHWLPLAAATAAIHAYLLAMVLPIWAASLLQRALLRRIGWRGALVEIVLTLGAVAIVMLLAGFFMTGSLGTYGFGSYKLNLLWPFISYDWSQILPSLPHTKFDYEGLSFFGIGLLALLALTIASGAIVATKAVFYARWWPLALITVAMAVFALSHKVAILDREWFELPLPQKLLDIFSAFRSSGRFVWPLLYVVTAGAVAILARRFRPIPVAGIAAIALVAQIADSAPKWQDFAAHLPPPSSTWKTSLDSAFWDRAADAGYTRLRAIPLQAYGGDWQALSYYAVTHRIATDAVYLGRTDDAAEAALLEKERHALATGDFEPRTLYILDAATAAQAATHLGPSDLLATIDSRIVFARGGAALVAGLGIDPRGAG
jgi:hypothetical protein